MAVALYMDVHVPVAITEALRRRGVDVLTAVEDDAATLPDDALLERAHELKRLLFTQDIRFASLAYQWQAAGRSFSGLVFGHQLNGTIGQYVHDLELIAQVSEPDEWLKAVEHLPF